MKILVTGGNGFIGKHLVERLAKEHEVLVLSRDHKGEGVITADIRDKDLDLKDFDVIYHLAGIAHAGWCEKNRDEAWDINVTGTLNILEHMHEEQQIIFASSAFVYNREIQEPHKEDEELKPGAFYAKTKESAEKIVRLDSKKRGLKHTIFRFFNVYGPEQTEGYLVPDAIKKYMTQDEVTVFNPGSERDFIYIDDLVDGLVAAIGVEGTFNLGSGKATKIGDVYRLISENLEKLGKKKAKSEKIETSTEDSVVSDSTKAEKEFGWKAKTTIEEGLKKTVESIQ